MAILNDNEVFINVYLDENTSLDFNKKNGLKKIRFTSKISSELGKPNYGLISQEGTLELYDFNGDIANNL